MFRLTAGAQQVFAGAGNDDIDGGAGDDELQGEDGEDVLPAAAGTTTSTATAKGRPPSGGPGDDRLAGDPFGPPVPDVLGGGPGLDLADFAFSSGTLRIDLDNQADDGRLERGTTFAAT